MAGSSLCIMNMTFYMLPSPLQEYPPWKTVYPRTGETSFSTIRSFPNRRLSQNHLPSGFAFVLILAPAKWNHPVSSRSFTQGHSSQGHSSHRNSTLCCHLSQFCRQGVFGYYYWRVRMASMSCLRPKSSRKLTSGMTAAMKVLCGY